MNSKFSLFDQVIVSGSATGFGDQEGFITNSDYIKMAESWYHDVTIIKPAYGQHHMVTVNEKFLQLIK